MSLTNSNHDLPGSRSSVAPGVDMQPDAVWATDITYIKTDEGYLYLANMMDRCTRRCVGWAMYGTLAATLLLAALDMALT